MPWPIKLSSRRFFCFYFLQDLPRQNLERSPVYMLLHPTSILLLHCMKRSASRGVLVIHEWWGLNDYTKRRANMLAEMGYIAMAVDMYGNNRRGNNPQEAGMLSGPYYENMAMTRKIFDAALEEFKKNPNVDQSKIAGIGYCFGGGLLLNLARMGEPLNGVVSFHGGLVGAPPDKNLTKAEILVCHGEADPFVPMEEAATFKKQMDSIDKAYTFKSYPGATHAFTNPDATELGKKFNIPIAYNGAADTASWNEMKIFFGKIFK